MARKGFPGWAEAKDLSVATVIRLLLLSGTLCIVMFAALLQRLSHKVDIQTPKYTSFGFLWFLTSIRTKKGSVIKYIVQ